VISRGRTLFVLWLIQTLFVVNYPLLTLGNAPHQGLSPPPYCPPDNDSLAVIIATELKSDVLMLGSDVPGIYRGTLAETDSPT